ncbi:hypothetical protein BGZ63DRAFT_238538 [Mariannaea sp. PMI_226]|nr:hypothetical protein BGZ63DRAFT_238538 [Mariannaea sp. PMI_226]
MLEAAIAASRSYEYGHHTAGESSNSAYGVYEYEDGGPTTPHASSDTHILATETEAEELDPRYRVEPPHRFQPGEIFKVLWPESQDDVTERAPSISDRIEVRDRFGGRIFMRFRRFIVIANDHGHCTCVPILTYGGKGCTKRGTKPEKHGIIYEKGYKARLLPGEPRLGFPPVKIHLTEEGEKLSKESRVNYSKLVTVEHNVKVLFIGRIETAQWDTVSEAVDRCWEQKVRRKRSLATEGRRDELDSRHSYPQDNPSKRDDSFQRYNFILEFSQYLFDSVADLKLDKQSLERISGILPDLLEAFASRFGHETPAQINHDIMVFIQTHWREIATLFETESYGQLKTSPDTPAVSSEELAEDELVGSWLSKQQVIRLEQSRFQARSADDADGPTSTIPLLPKKMLDEDSKTGESRKKDQNTQDDHGKWLSGHRDLVLESEAFRWLRESLRAELHLSPTEPRINETIRLQIIRSLRPSIRENGDASTQLFLCLFQVCWNPSDFLERQGYTTKPAEAVPTVITLTGSHQDAQALTCAQYLNQTWPVTGEATMQLVKDVLGSEPHRRHTCNYPDGTNLSAWSDGQDFMIEVFGIADSVAEVGEQFAWLGAALRVSPVETGLVHCVPSIKDIRKTSATTLLPAVLSLHTATYRIEFITDEGVQPASDISNGQCWHDMFMNPVIVKGYPIPARIEFNSGLEIPLNIMAELAGTHQVDRFNEKIFIKGFSTLLVPTKQKGDILFWHLIYNKDGSRISYLDNTVAHAKEINNLDLGKLRHVLGWCAEAKFLAGSSEINYLVGHSGLPRPHDTGALANQYVSPGRYIVGGTVFRIGTKDTPVHVVRNGYIPKLQWINTKSVLLWDEADKRGWLVNGTSALLYLVRASLDLNSRDKFSAAFVFRNEHLQESPTPFTADSAIDVLINPENLALRLYHDKDGFLLLESRIDHFYSILEKLIDHQFNIAGENGTNIMKTPRQDLEGWDFKDLITNCDPLYPRVATLEDAGKGWVDFTRARYTVTLFGRGFGELIKPASVDICDYWAELPKEQYYIAICLSDLAQGIETHSRYNDDHVRLSEDIIMHTPTTIFGSCRCKGVFGPDHCEPVQTLLPASMLRFLSPRNVPIPQGSPGAVIFGHNSVLPWVWGDHGDPKVGTLPASRRSESGSSPDSDLSLALRPLELEHSPQASQSDGLGKARSRIAHGIDAVSPSSSSSTSDGICAREDYTVGIICGLPKELLAVRALFDKKHSVLSNFAGDSNNYSFGEIQRHMVVAACLPAGEYGTNSAADSASNMKRSFPNIIFCLLVGIGGGAPLGENDIRLGDVVVSLPTAKHPGVIQYDRGKENENSAFEMTGALHSPPRFLMTAISSLTSDPDLPFNPLEPYLNQIVECIKGPQRLKYKHPGQERDEFFRVACSQCQERAPCAGHEGHKEKRSPRLTNDPEIHYGLIASGNRVIKGAHFRNQWAREHGVLCFETEAAGIMNIFPCLVIRGICDYADSYKNKVWQEYAAATAAAYAKLLLGRVTPFEVLPGVRQSQSLKYEARVDLMRKRQRIWSDLE